jgi:hypothetical protein
MASARVFQIPASDETDRDRLSGIERENDSRADALVSPSSFTA